jgi:uncharacterized glyoxalase superfamily protein PhnB
MPDAFEVLRSPLIPAAPDPAFVARLRSRVQRALAQPEGADMSTAVVEDTPRPAALIPYLAVGDARAALDWYVAALGARRRGDPIVMPDGRIGHAELELRGQPLYLSDESPESHVGAPRAGADATVTLVLEVADVDATVERAVAEGASLERPPTDHPYGRNAVIRDPFGHRWMVSGQPNRLRQGDLAYVSLWVPDVVTAAEFYAAALGWTYEPGSAGQGRQVVGTTLNHGLWGGEPRPTLFLCFAVDDLGEALARVRAAGGSHEAPSQHDYGLVAMCQDDQGMPFSLYQLEQGDPGARGPANGARPGDLSYVTMEVADSGRARAFFGSVLGWRFRPGRVDDGWGVEDVVPMTGMQGGHDVATVVPMYRVEDVAAAVERVRAAGGTATDPQAQPYGVTAECVDNQGTRFYLGET